VVWRDGKEVTLPAVLDEKPSDDKLASADSKPTSPNTAPSESRALAGLGLTVAPITDESRQKYRLGDDQKGVVITDVEQNGVAAERGLKPGDVIVEVQQAEVGSPDDLAKKIEAQRSQDRKSVLMLIQGQDGERYVPLPLSKGKASKPG
jgi:serine protease Do